MPGLDGPVETEEARTPQAEGEQRQSAPPRLISVDATRGFAMVILLLAGSAWHRSNLPDQLRHPEWHGVTFADLFFPLFLFVVGISMTLSRRAGEARPVLKRVALLFLIGVALSSLKARGFAPHGVLQHIAVSYLLAWLVLQAPRKLQLLLTLGIFAGVWAAFVLWAGGRDPWSSEATVAHAVDGFFIGRFATEGTLQTIMSTVTVLGGAFIGRGIRAHRDPQALLKWVTTHALWLVVAALALSEVVPLNKRIWTPSFTLLTLGTSCVWLALFIWLVDIRGQRRAVLPLRWLGANPIAVYVTYMTVTILLAPVPMPELAPFGSRMAGALTYSVGWLIVGLVFARELYRRRIFIKI
jgi:predicted acyltransferase